MAKYKRILLKLSGESLMGEKQYGIDEKRLAEYAEQIKEIHQQGVLPDCDMISFGPDIIGAHTPLEHLGIESTQRMYDYTLKLLEKLK